MISKKLFFVLILIILTSCSFDNKTGLWKGGEDEKKRVLELENEQKDVVAKNKVFSSENVYREEKKLLKNINLSTPKNSAEWKMSGLNHKNLLSNIYSSGVDNIFLKKKIGKNNSSISKITNSPLFYKDNLILSDNRGTIFKITQNGKVIWKRNIYKKIYKKIYKNLTLSIYKDNIFVSDNIGFIYKINFSNGEIVWIKNHGIPLKSKIKVINDKIFLTNQDNRFLAFSTKDGSVIWNVRAVSSFIKLQNLLSTAVTDNGFVISSNTSGDLLKVNSKTGNVEWSINALESMLAHATDFFKSSNIVIANDAVIFSTQSSIFSFDLKNGYVNWEAKASFLTTPIIDNKNIFFVTEHGYFIIMNLDNGEIISSVNILKILKKKKQKTKVVGFIMGSGKIYTTTLNGYLITSSASSGKVEDYKKIANAITSSPIISNGKIFIYTKDSKILGLN